MDRYMPDAADGDEPETFIETFASVLELKPGVIWTISRYIAFW
jgi:hypothetical protein